VADLIDNERTKLLANALDRASTAVFTVGVITPCVSYFFNLQEVREALGPVGLAAFVALSFLSSAGLHLLARSVLGDLRE
jgi:mannitol/fructose-specific phosphotransferase system IIA component (Ntr-type)